MTMTTRSEHATIYRLSATLEATIRRSGTITLQRNERPPLKLSNIETRNLRAALAEHDTTPTTTTTA